MPSWLVLPLPSAFVGIVAAMMVKRPMAIVVGAGAAWFGMLAFLLFDAYLMPYRGGGASMWPIAQMFGGTLAAGVAGATAAVVAALRATTQREGKR